MFINSPGSITILPDLNFKKRTPHCIAEFFFVSYASFFANPVYFVIKINRFTACSAALTLSK